jgi:thiol:disulfide interchange protein DsbD
MLLFPAVPAAAQTYTSAYSEVALISETKGVVRGKTAWLGLHIKTKPGWHTYWRNPGESGLATQIDWSLPGGLSVGGIQWPVPQKFKLGPVTSYGYKNEALLLVPLTVDSRIGTNGVAALTATANWLVCGDICVPERATFKLSLPVVDSNTGPATALFQTYRENLPAGPPILATGSQTEDRVTLTVDASARDWGPVDRLAFFAATEGAVEPGAPQTIAIEDRKLIISVKPGFLAQDKKLTVVEGVLVSHSIVNGKIRRKGVKLTANFKPGA